MKELTIEQKAKAYDKAIERVVNIKTGKCETTFIFTEGLFDYLFPELEECNEEEVREAMIDFFKHEREEGVVVSHYGVNIERMIAWLEKQKTSEEAIQYLKENHSPSEVSDFQAAMNIAVAKAYDKGVKDGLEKQGEQKPAWSEKDEEMFMSLYSPNFTKEQRDWLKSLKDRIGCELNCTTMWKPSDEQMEALEQFISEYKDIDDDSRAYPISHNIESLYNDLKKLTE